MVESWYLAYALLGAVTAGLVPILLPLTVIKAGSPTLVGLVMAAVSLGGLSAPIWGTLADRYRLHRGLLVGGFILIAVSLAAFVTTSLPGVWVGLSLLQGVGVAAAATVANLFVIEAHAQTEWDERIGWLQSFYGGGQVIGLLLAGLLGQNYPVGLLIAAVMAVLAGLMGWAFTKTPLVKVISKPILLRTSRSGEWPPNSPGHYFHHLSSEAWESMHSAFRSPFGLFLFLWLVSYGGVAAVFSLYPVLMQQGYGITQNIASIVFALAAATGLVLYSPAGRWSERKGALYVLRAGLVIRLIAAILLLGLGVFHPAGLNWLAAAAFCGIVLAWSYLSVSGTTLVANISSANEGAGMGLFNATTALAGVFGAVSGGWIATRWGYQAVPILAFGGVLLGLVFTFFIQTPASQDLRK